jgi:hypothetical protein
MVRTEQLAEAALAGDALLLRSLTMDWLSEHRRLADVPAPNLSDATMMSIAAGLVELLAGRRHEPAPQWTKEIGAAEHPVHLIKAARTMRRLRELCEAESPEPLRKRNLFATPTFLQFA